MTYRCVARYLNIVASKCRIIVVSSYRNKQVSYIDTSKYWILKLLIYLSFQLQYEISMCSEISKYLGIELSIYLSIEISLHRNIELSFYSHNKIRRHRYVYTSKYWILKVLIWYISIQYEMLVYHFNIKIKYPCAEWHLTIDIQKYRNIKVPKYW